MFESTHYTVFWIKCLIKSTQWWHSACACISRSCHGLEVLSLLREMETLMSLNPIRSDSQFQKPQHSIRKFVCKILFYSLCQMPCEPQVSTAIEAVKCAFTHRKRFVVRPWTRRLCKLPGIERTVQAASVRPRGPGSTSGKTGSQRPRAANRAEKVSGTGQRVPSCSEFLLLLLLFWALDWFSETHNTERNLSIKILSFEMFISSKSNLNLTWKVKLHTLIVLKGWLH